MSLETHIAGSEDRLIDGLHFAGRNTASYITSRQNVSFAPDRIQLQAQWLEADGVLIG